MLQPLYLLPFLAVFSGYILAMVVKLKNKKNTKLLLAFSGSFLLSVTVLHLLPEVYQSHHDTHDHDHQNPIGIFIMTGILLQIILEYFSKGAEHGHVHGHKKITRIPWSLFISLCLHALLEGLPISHHNELSLGIAIHHFPIAVILTSFLIQADLNKTALFLFMITFALMTPLGTVLSNTVPVLTEYYTEIAAIVIGILFHISSTIIFESNEDHTFNYTKLGMILIGVLCACFV